MPTPAGCWWSAPSYARPPKVSRQLSRRQQGQPREVRAISWRAQNRLHHRYTRLLGQPAILQVQMLARQLLQLGLAIKEYDRQIAQCFALHRDAAIWQSFPGAGATLAPRLACAFGSERSRYPDARAIQQYSGVAPVTEKSGKNQHRVHRRYSRPHFIHQSFFEYAGQSALHCQWAKLFLQELIARGKSHSSAVRALAFKWSRSRGICLLA